MSFMRVLSLVVPLRRDTSPSAVGVLRDHGSGANSVLTRLACVVNCSLQFVHAVSVYQLRTLVLLTNEFDNDDNNTGAGVPPFHVSIVVIPSPRQTGAPSVLATE